MLYYRGHRARYSSAIQVKGYRIVRMDHVLCGGAFKHSVCVVLFDSFYLFFFPLLLLPCSCMPLSSSSAILFLFNFLTISLFVLQRSPSRESGSPRSPPSSRCCDTGRPLFTDPLTGHTVCSCQYQDMLAYQRLPALYPAPYPPEVAAYFPAAAAAAAASLPDQPPFYPAVSTTLYTYKFIFYISSRK